MIRVPTHREPTHLGEFLSEEFLKPMDLTQRELAAGIRVPYLASERTHQPAARGHPGHGTEVGQVLREYAGALGRIEQVRRAG